MIDLDVIERQCKSAIDNGYGHLPVVECGNAVKLMEVITRLSQAEKDAARYRWLREPKCELEPNGEPKSLIDVTMWTNDGEDNVTHGETICMELMDDAIDEAMQCNK